MANEQHPGPWVWDSICGEWGLWDAAGEPLIMEYTFSDPSESARLDPYVEAVTAAAPEMLALLRRLCESVCYDDQQSFEDMRHVRQLLIRIDEAGK